MKQKTEEKQLLADAILWFEQKYSQSPKECGIGFIKVWYKPTPFKKTPAVVFAQTEEAGKAFIWEQNALWNSIRYFWIAPVLFITAFFTAFSQTTIEATNTIMNIVTALCVVCIVFFLYLAIKCKKLENPQVEHRNLLSVIYTSRVLFSQIRLFYFATKKTA